MSSSTPEPDDGLDTDIEHALDAVADPTAPAREFITQQVEERSLPMGMVHRFYIDRATGEVVEAVPVYPDTVMMDEPSLTETYLLVIEPEEDADGRVELAAEALDALVYRAQVAALRADRYERDYRARKPSQVA